MSTNLKVRVRSEEHAVLDLHDDEIERLFKSAKAGRDDAKHKLYEWTYLTAHRYYQSKISVEEFLSPEDAEELTTDFFLEFERSLGNLKSATRFTRYVLKRNLGRYLKQKKKRLRREVAKPTNELEGKVGTSQSPHAWENWSDEDFLQYQTVLESLKDADEITQKILQYRIKEPPLQYKEISEQLKMSETAIRMRVTRFYALVRKKYKKTSY